MSLYIDYLRGILNEAKQEYNDEKLGLIRIKGSPFSQFRIPASLAPINALCPRSRYGRSPLSDLFRGYNPFHI